MTSTELVVQGPLSISFASAPPAAVADGANDALASTVGAVLSDLFGDFRSITFGQGAFHIRANGVKQTLLDVNGQPDRNLYVVILNVAPASHCLWWAEGFDSESSAPPDAVWYENEAPPSNVPDWVLTTKKQQGKKEFKHYSKKRRVVTALLSNSGGSLGVDVDSLYVMDIGESSMFMKDEPPALSFIGLMRFCQKFGAYPCDFITRVSFDYSGSGAPSTLRFSPMTDPGTGQFQFFDAALCTKLRGVAASKDVLDLLKVRTQAPAAPAPAAPAPAAPAPAAPPPSAPAPAGVADMSPVTAGSSAAELLTRADAALEAFASSSAPLPAAPASDAPAPQGSTQSELDANLTALFAGLV